MRMAFPCVLSLIITANLLCSTSSSLALQEKPETGQEQKTKQKAGKDEEQDAADKLLRTLATYIAQDVMASEEVDDKLVSAHLKADFASLLCEAGAGDKSIEAFKKSFEQIMAEALKKDNQHDPAEENLPTLALRIANSTMKCDPSAQAWFATRLKELQPDESNEKKLSGSATEAYVVGDKLWGSRPSVQRQIAADFLAGMADEKIAKKRFDEARSLLERSLSFCVVTGFITTLARLREDQPNVSVNLFVQACRRVSSLPSGVEVSDLSFGLKPMLDLDLAQREAILAKAGANRVAVEAYLDAVTALVQGPNSHLAARSPDTLRMVKDTIPLFSLFRVQMIPQIEFWVSESSRLLPQEERAAVESVPFANQSFTRQTTTIEEIAAGSKDEKERDQAYASLASTNIQRGKFDAGIEYASKILDLDLRQQVLDDLRFVKVARLTRFVKPQDLFSLFQDIPPITSMNLRVRAYTLFAVSAHKNNTVLAMDALQEAARLASKMDWSPVRVHLLLSIAEAYGGIDILRMQEVLSDAVKSINNNRQQPPSRWGRATIDTVTIKFDSKWRFPRTVVDDPAQYKRPYDFGAFGKLALADFEGARSLANQLSDKSLRASALYEMCAAVLLKKAKSKEDSKAPPPPKQTDER